MSSIGFFMKKLAGIFLLMLASSLALSAEFKKEQDCVVGAQVTDRQNKTGTVTSVSKSMCRVKLDDGKETSYLFWMLRPAGTSAVTSDRLVSGTYMCYSSAGNTLNYMFMDIVIDGPTSYRDKQGTKGSYKLDEATGKIVFESGPLTTANAKLLAGPKIGLNMSGGRVFNTTCGLKKR
jgi:hypothetical protein